MKNYRKCIGCGKIKPKKELIKLQYDKENNELLVNTNSKIFGRSAYLCYNKSCIENAIKKNKMDKALKQAISKESKGKLIEFE